jgi:hypothetical protein
MAARLCRSFPDLCQWLLHPSRSLLRLRRSHLPGGLAPPSSRQSMLETIKYSSRQWQSLHRFGNPPIHLFQQASRVCQSPSSLSQWPFRVCQCPTGVCQRPFRVCQCPIRVCQSSFRVCQSPIRACQWPPRVREAKLAAMQASPWVGRWTVPLCLRRLRKVKQAVLREEGDFRGRRHPSGRRRALRHKEIPHRGGRALTRPPG